MLNVLQKMDYTILYDILLIWYHIRKANNEALLFAEFILATYDLSPENGIHYLSVYLSWSHSNSELWKDLEFIDIHSFGYIFYSPHTPLPPTLSGSFFILFFYFFIN